MKNEHEVKKDSSMYPLDTDSIITKGVLEMCQKEPDVMRDLKKDLEESIAHYENQKEEYGDVEFDDYIELMKNMLMMCNAELLEQIDSDNVVNLEEYKKEHGYE